MADWARAALDVSESPMRQAAASAARHDGGVVVLNGMALSHSRRRHERCPAGTQMTQAGTRPRGNESAYQQPANQADRKSKMSCTLKAPELLKSARQQADAEQAAPGPVKRSAGPAQAPASARWHDDPVQHAPNVLLATVSVKAPNSWVDSNPPKQG